LLALLAAVAGCGGQPPRSVDHAEVTGKVLLQGKPVPGGQVSFVAVTGGFAASGNIDENGNYQIKAPVGEVKITVNNTALQGRKGAGGKGAAGPKQLPHPKQSGAEEPNAKTQWVSIPSRYSNADTTDLKYTVTPGPQTHDINLSS
ncbi:unnamed protein product, partial [Phaeothamnion confervicola]